ncbi:DNA repair protein RecN [Listeria sp. PSOL-1]|uniref:DNA repair protein RecN n=1 Tax=Listeria sp. PSOL-1 TaxID=1844999 RepID=UPI0013D74B59|nr:DNA repair protein RecN [Listeria sp. PSOL-1]
MLQELTIKNFAIIESLELSFEEGMTVLTGETGAGKSIIIDALGLLVGGRGSSQLIRHGAESLELQALFALSDEDQKISDWLLENGIDSSDKMIVLERILYKTGKNSCRVNGKLVTTVLLRDLGSRLIDIHSQHEHQELLHDEFHLNLLDRFSVAEIGKLKQEYQTLFHKWQEADQELQNWTKNEQELAQRLDMLRFQHQEIEAAQLVLGEEEDLNAQKNTLANFEKLNENLSGAYQALEKEQGGLTFIGEAMRQLEVAKEISSDYEEVSEAVSSSYYMLEDAVTEIRQALERMEFQPDELNRIENRLAEMSQLKRKYGKTIENIMAYHTEIQSEIDQLADSESHVTELEAKCDQLKAEAEQMAEKLSLCRKKAATLLEKQIKEELNQLYMDKAIFKVEFEKTKQLGKDGYDQVAFHMSTNPGEPLKPLAKVASGGELSRMMLALKSIFSKHQGITSIIFDEVDTGVSGRVAQAIAEKIYTVSVGSQVLCISHLPQVAAMADYHFYITKEVIGKRTKTSVDVLIGADREVEIGRMIAGSEITELAKSHAKEMLDLAAKIKQNKN